MYDSQYMHDSFSRFFLFYLYANFFEWFYIHYVKEEVRGWIMFANYLS